MNLRIFPLFVNDKINVQQSDHMISLPFAHCVILHDFLLLSADNISKLTFSKKSFKNTIRVSNSLDPDKARQFVRLTLGPNYLQR